MLATERPATGKSEGTEESERRVRLRPRRPTISRESTAWPIALRMILRYARSAGRGGRGRATARDEARLRGGEHRYNQRCSVRVTYSLNRTGGLWRAHGRYVARESAAQEHSGFNATETGIDVAGRLHKWQAAGDERLWKIIISPEFGERMDLEKLTREILLRMAWDLDTELEWVAVAHFNTDHPHVHLALRGRRRDGTPLRLSPDYVRHGMRLRAEEACTLQLGYRTELDASDAEQRQVPQRRYTSLDRIIARGATETRTAPNGAYFGITEELPSNSASEFAHSQARHVHARLLALEEMGLALQTGPRSWNVRRDFEVVLRAMQRTGDRQKALSAHGALVSDARLGLTIVPARQAEEIEGRILLHGEDHRSQHYLLIEGADGRIHFVYYTLEMEEARSRGQLRTNSFVRLHRRFIEGQPVTKIEDFGNAEKLLNNRNYFEATAQRLRELGVFPVQDGWGGWLGRYQAALHQAACGMDNPSARERRRDLER